MTINKVES